MDQQNSFNQYNWQPINNVPYQPETAPGRGLAIGSLIIGIIGLTFWVFFGLLTSLLGIISIVLGCVGLFLAARAKSHGFNGGIRTAGFVVNVLALVFGTLRFVACATFWALWTS